MAISYLLLSLHHGINAFQSTPRYHNAAASALGPKLHQFTSTSILRTASLESIPSLESILDDGNGHINSNLAQAIYEWEGAHNANRQQQNTAQIFSTRDGLRMVDELAREILSSIGMGETRRESKEGTSSYNDLVQEGMIALMHAMSTYSNYKSHTTATKISSFEEYAKQSIQSSFLHFLSHSSSCPIRLPLSLQTTLQSANIAAQKLRQQLGKEPSLVQVATEVDIAPEQLALYRKLHRSMVSRVGTFVSVEDGVEVYDPTLAGVGAGTGLRSRRDWSVGSSREGGASSAAASDTASADEFGSDSGQGLTHVNSQEDNWTSDPPERTVAPLKDVLTDTEETNNPLSYMHHHLLNEELNEFLLETLSERELTVIQLRFGLVDSKHGGKGWTAKSIGKRLDMDQEDVVRVASAALEKLRKGASRSLDEDNDAYVEISL